MFKRKSSSEPSDTTTKKKPNLGHWSSGLLKTMNNPEYIIKKDELVTVIKDMYPKAQFHYLIMPNESINNLRSITKDKHLDLLKHMDKVARDLISDDTHKIREFKIGYHAEPSMNQLHLHVISDDFKSTYLKHKKHWNSFNTKFFMNSKDVIDSLENTGKIDFIPSKEAKNYLSLPLKCNKCDTRIKSMPDLQLHLSYLPHYPSEEKD